MIYRLKYQALTAATRIRNISACVAFLAGSYVVSGFINAAPVTQPALTRPRSNIVIVTIPAAVESERATEEPAKDLEAPLEPKPWAIHTL